MYCPKCGKENSDSATYCDSCGAPLKDVPTTYNCVAENNSNSAKKTMYLITFVLSLIATISFGFLLIPLAWMIPMTVKIYNAYKNNTVLSTGFKVCVLLFNTFIGGIILLFADMD